MKYVWDRHVGAIAKVIEGGNLIHDGELAISKQENETYELQIRSLCEA